MNNHNYELWCKLDISTFHNNVMVLTIRPHILWMQIIKTDHLDNMDPLDHLDNHKHLDHLYWCFMLCCRKFCAIFLSVLSVFPIFFAFFGLWSIRQKKETLPKAKRPESWVQLKKVTWLSHITSSNTNLNQILESLLSTISTKHQHLAET